MNPPSSTTVDRLRDSEQQQRDFNCISSLRVIFLCIPDSKSHLSIRSNSLSEPVLDSNTSFLLWANYSSNPPVFRRKKKSLHASYSFPFISHCAEMIVSPVVPKMTVIVLFRVRKGNVGEECLFSLLGV